MPRKTIRSSHITQFAYLNNTFAILLVAVLLVVISAASAQAQYLAWPPGERDKGLMNCAPEHCVFYLSVAATGKYDAKANPTEAWIGQPEIQASLEKLVDATEKFAQKNSSNSPAGKLLFEQSPAEFLKQPMAFFLTKVANNEDVDANSGAFLVKLDGLEERATAVLRAALAEADLNAAKKELKGKTYYVIESSNENPTINVGIVDNYFILTFGRLPLEDVVASLDTPPPAWLTELDQRMAIDRPAVTTYVNFEALHPLLEDLPKSQQEDFQKANGVFLLTDFQTLQFQNGMNTNGFNQIGYLNHAQPDSGLLSVLATETLTAKDLAEVPEDVSLAAAFKLAPDNITKLVKQAMESDPNRTGPSYDEFLQTCKDETGFDFERDFIASIDGSFWVYTDPSLTSPKFVAAAKTKDAEKFAKVLEASIGKIKQLFEKQGTQFNEEQKGENTFYTLTPPSGQAFSFGLVDGQLYFSNSLRGITSHLRKKKRSTGKLVNTDWMKGFLEEGKSDGYKGVIGFSTYDLATAFEVGLPFARIMLGQYSNPDVFDFTFDDVPEVGVLVNGLRPNRTAYFRTETGVAIHTVHDFPIAVEASSGILIGMLLPAIQQVRAAARAAQSKNNMQQIGLALLNYATANNGHFPPAYSVDDDGNPLLSWRVHILPYLEQQELYDQFKLDEPWDSPHNIVLADQIPAVYLHPGLAPEANHTAYITPLNDNSILNDGPINDEGEGNEFEKITDGTSNTLLLIEANEDRAVVWTSPKDLLVDELNDDELIESLNGYLNRFTFVLCDGSIHMLRTEETAALNMAKLRGGFKMSDGVLFDLSP